MGSTQTSLAKENFSLHRPVFRLVARCRAGIFLKMRKCDINDVEPTAIRVRYACSIHQRSPVRIPFLAVAVDTLRLGFSSSVRICSISVAISPTCPLAMEGADAYQTAVSRRTTCVRRPSTLPGSNPGAEKGAFRCAAFSDTLIKHSSPRHRQLLASDSRAPDAAVGGYKGVRCTCPFSVARPLFPTPEAQAQGEQMGTTMTQIGSAQAALTRLAPFFFVSR